MYGKQFNRKFPNLKCRLRKSQKKRAGSTKFEDLPESWKVVRLGKVAEIIREPFFSFRGLQYRGHRITFLQGRGEVGEISQPFCF